MSIRWYHDIIRDHSSFEKEPTWKASKCHHHSMERKLSSSHPRITCLVFSSLSLVSFLPGKLMIAISCVSRDMIGVHALNARHPYKCALLLRLSHNLLDWFVFFYDLHGKCQYLSLIAPHAHVPSPTCGRACISYFHSRTYLFFPLMQCINSPWSITTARQLQCFPRLFQSLFYLWFKSRVV